MNEEKRQEPIAQFLEKMAEKCRVGGCIDSKRSYIWTVASHKRDLYIAQAATGRSLKISLHASGRFRDAFEDGFHRGLVELGIVDPAANRAITVWDRPDGNGRLHS
ncbi:hypothetical protein [Mesorhizobium sp. WSM4313]|uniref:hypothetical protein n=1 Tax=Mesorhizobium sp. WSM4313 TaxID=2029412 RepID=UPI0011410AC9|nr:hypothetical protein [Mesorhizobium sp. WSM4313]